MQTGRRAHKQCLSLQALNRHAATDRPYGGCRRETRTAECRPYDDTVTGGHDEVYNYDFENNDVIWLGDTTLDDISGTSIEDNAVTIEFKNGGSLTVNSTDNVRVRINEGAECYIADKETGTWSHE